MSSERANRIAVSVVYAKPESCIEHKINVPHGTTVGEVLERSETKSQFSEVTDFEKVGIFGTLVKRDCELQEGDRIELYCGLIADPKDARRKRVKVLGTRDRD